MPYQSVIVKRVSKIEHVEVLMQAFIARDVDIIAGINDSTGYYIYGKIGINKAKFLVSADIDEDMKGVGLDEQG